MLHPDQKYCCGDPFASNAPKIAYENQRNDMLDYQQVQKILYCIPAWVVKEDFIAQYSSQKTENH
jgi:hypothetical protein